MKRLILILLLPAIIVAQELDATVVVNYEQLTNIHKERLVNFGRAVQDYLNNNKFSGQNWEFDRIKCNFNIFFSKTSEEFKYGAQVVITSQRKIFNSTKVSLMLTVFDNSWEFSYEKNQALYFNQSDFDPITSFLDFYALIIIGMDMDSYGPEPFGGSDLFTRASDIAVRGSSSLFSDSWQIKSTSYNKRGLVDNLLNTNYQQFRQDFMDYHFSGLDLFNEDRKTAYSNMVKLVNNLAEKKDRLDPRSSLLKIFFDAKAGEFSEFLKDYPDKEVFETLKRIDPSHTSKYDAAFGF